MGHRLHAGAALLDAFSLAVLIAACGDDSSAPVTPGANEVVVDQNLDFTPPHLTVAAGTTVRWRNVGSIDHTVTSGSSSKAADDPGADFDADFKPGATVEQTFDAPGDHPYFCRFHESMGMKGVITVTAAAPAAASTSATSGNGNR